MATVLRRVAQTTLDRDASIGEVAHVQLQQKLVYSSAYNVNVRLVWERKINPVTKKLELNDFMRYAQRTQHLGLSMQQFFEEFHFRGERIQKHPKNRLVVVNFTPNPSFPPGHDLHWVTCKNNLLRYRPWAGSPAAAWDAYDAKEPVYDAAAHDQMFGVKALDLPKEQRGYIACWQHYSSQDEATRRSVPPWKDAFSLDANSGAQFRTLSGVDPAADLPHFAEGEVQASGRARLPQTALQRLGANFTAADDDDGADDDADPNGVDDDDDDGGDAIPPCSLATAFSSPLLLEGATGIALAHVDSWLDDTRNSLATTRPGTTAALASVTNPARARGPEQEYAFRLLEAHAALPVPAPPIHMMLTGTAGTGKSTLLQQIEVLLGSRLLLTATTGLAASNISRAARTLSSALKMPIKLFRRGDLADHVLQFLQRELKDVHYLIVDEVSMMGGMILYWIDRRLRQIKGNDEPFGGLSVILCGDFGQLPPVDPLDAPLYCAGHTKYASKEVTTGLQLYSEFFQGPLAYAIVLKQVFRQEGTSANDEYFRQLLLRMRDMCLTSADVAWIGQHFLQVKNLDGEMHRRRIPGLDHVTHLFYDNSGKQRANNSRLNDARQPIWRSDAQHKGGDAAAKVGDRMYRGAVRQLCLSLGSPVMLNSNLWVAAGLCNGARGTVRYIHLASDAKAGAVPLAVFVEFKCLQEPALKFPCFGNLPLGVIPIVPISIPYEAAPNSVSKRNTWSRRQIPLVLCHALTVHKSQGQSFKLGPTVHHIYQNGREPCAGHSFVAASRCSNPDQYVVTATLPWAGVREHWTNLHNVPNANRIPLRIAEDKALLARFERMTRVGVKGVIAELCNKAVGLAATASAGVPAAVASARAAVWTSIISGDEPDIEEAVLQDDHVGVGDDEFEDAAASVADDLHDVDADPHVFDIDDDDDDDDGGGDKNDDENDEVVRPVRKSRFMSVLLEDEGPTAEELQADREAAELDIELHTSILP
jgi:hypothetical protein